MPARRREATSARPATRGQAPRSSRRWGQQTRGPGSRARKGVGAGAPTRDGRRGSRSNRDNGGRGRPCGSHVPSVPAPAPGHGPAPRPWQHRDVWPSPPAVPLPPEPGCLPLGRACGGRRERPAEDRGGDGRRGRGGRHGRWVPAAGTGTAEAVRAAACSLSSMASGTGSKREAQNRHTGRRPAVGVRVDRSARGRAPPSVHGWGPGPGLPAPLPTGTISDVKPPPTSQGGNRKRKREARTSAAVTAAARPGLRAAGRPGAPRTTHDLPSLQERPDAAGGRHRGRRSRPAGVRTKDGADAGGRGGETEAEPSAQGAERAGNKRPRGPPQGPGEPRPSGLQTCGSGRAGSPGRPGGLQRGPRTSGRHG